jgi:hypothetical protein
MFMKTNQRLNGLQALQAFQGFGCSVLLLLAGVIIVQGGGGGCAPKKTPPPAPMTASPARVQEIRTAYWRAYPDSRVGVINATRKQDKLVAVGEINGSDFREGETVVIIDEKQKVLANGTIVRVLVDQVHVQYQVAKGGRDPVVGDLMVRIPPGGTTL